MKRTFPALIISLTLLILIASCTSNQRKNDISEAKSKDDYTVASYYFPNYHVDKRNEKALGENWTEWTEGSYLEPDTIHGMAYLEAIKEVFE